MKISHNWLKGYIPELIDANKLADVLTYHLTEVEGMETLDDGDVIFDINILPNRAHDLLSHQGMAREISGQLGLKYNDPIEMYQIPESQKTKLEIKIESENCRRYMGRIIRNIKVGPSPQWVVKYLESIGQRSINNIVDATNIVMYDCGQPCHAYDLSKINNEKIVIKNSKLNEKLPVVGRDNIIAELLDTDLVITDGVQNLALAGVKGGLDSGISENTTDIVLEVANFNPTSIRKTARRLNLLSDSAKRFENDLSTEHASYAMRELSALFLDPQMNCEDAIFEEIIDIYPNPQKQNTISFSLDLINKKLGSNIKENEVEEILNNYKYNYTVSKSISCFEVTVPALRLDLENPIDMVEEIGRIYGYDKIVPTKPVLNFSPQENQINLNIKKAQDFLISTGYKEVMTYSLNSTGDVEILASASDKNFLRTNLLEGLTQSYELNKLNAPLLSLNTKEVKIFEIGKVFLKKENTIVEQINVAFVDNKNKIEKSLEDFILSIKDEEVISLEIIPGSNDVFKTWSNMPFITRDISVWVPNDTEPEILFNLYKKYGTDLLVLDPQLIDNFEKEGRVSYSYRLVFQSKDRTLVDAEISSIIENINKELLKINGLELR